MNGQIFADGYLKVWKGGKCNLVDENEESASPEWVNDFVLSKWHKESYLSDIKSGAFLVVKANKKNLLFKGNFIFDQWFTEIDRYREPYYLGNAPKEEAYSVRDGYMSGIYYLGKGLVGGRLYETISRIFNNLYFCRYDNEGHIMSLDGKIITTASIREIGPFQDGYAIVSNAPFNSYDGFQYNFINTEGKLVSPIWYDGDRYMHFGYYNDEQPNYGKHPTKCISSPGIHRAIFA